MLPKTLADQKQILRSYKVRLSSNKKFDEPFPCSFDDPRVIETMKRLKEKSNWMVKMGIPRLVDKGPHRFTSAAQTDVGKLFDEIRRLKTGVARRVK